MQTEDGATIALHHHPGDGPPVLIVHGISSNHRCWDLSPERSVATALVAAGFDPWLLDLRGHGDALTDAQGRRQWGGWTMDDYGQHDVPAAVAYVLAQTGEDKIGYVGHSLGGMIGAVVDEAQHHPALEARHAVPLLAVAVPRLHDAGVERGDVDLADGRGHQRRVVGPHKLRQGAALVVVPGQGPTQHALNRHGRVCNPEDPSSLGSERCVS